MPLQGVFTLVGVSGGVSCMRCVLARDPVARRQMDRLQRYRAEYDKWGNRIPRSVDCSKETRR